MAQFFVDILRADRLLDGGVAFTAKAYAIAPEEPVELEGMSDLTLTGSADALFGYLGKVIELVPVAPPAAPRPRPSGPMVGGVAPAARGDSGLVG